MTGYPHRWLRSVLSRNYGTAGEKGVSPIESGDVMRSGGIGIIINYIRSDGERL